MGEIFDKWPKRYEKWFKTPIGQLVEAYERQLVFDMLLPGPGERILDAGCGIGVFTGNLLEEGAVVTGLEISLPMLKQAADTFRKSHFQSVQGDMRHLPFPDGRFDKTVSITAIEFVADAENAIREMFRVTKPAGYVVAATLNSLSPWAQSRKTAAQKGHSVFRHAIFRSPDQVLALSPVDGTARTAIHFQRNEDPQVAKQVEADGQRKELKTGAFVAACWKKPGEPTTL